MNVWNIGLNNVTANSLVIEITITYLHITITKI